MHARHRSPGNGYRSGSMGIGFRPSRISPEASGRGRGSFYNSEYRSFNNRGFERGQGQGQGQVHPRTFQPPPQPPPPRKGDILMEAGKLAFEFMASKGLLPSNALSGRWQNGSFKKQTGNCQEIRSEEDLSLEGQTSASARLGSGASDSGLGKRRFPDDFNLRDHMKERRRGEYQRGFSSDGSREYERSGSWSGKTRVSPDMERELDNISGQHEEEQKSKAASDEHQHPRPSEMIAENEEPGATDLKPEKQINQDEMGSKESSSSAGKDDTDGDQIKGSDVSRISDMVDEEMRDREHNDETEKQIVQDIEGDLSGQNSSDLATLSKFANMPTKPRTSLVSEASKVDQVHCDDEDNAPNMKPLKGSEILLQDVTSDVSAADALTNNTNDSKISDSEITELLVQSGKNDERELETSFGTGHGKCMRSRSFPDRSFMHNNVQESDNNDVSGFGRSASVIERGEKRVAEDGDMNEAVKKPREWLPNLSKAEEPSSLSYARDTTVIPQEESVASDQLVIGNTGDCMHDSRQFPGSESQQCVKYEPENPSSFKICDLNLMETADANDGHRNETVHMHPSAVMPKKEAHEVDIDLSISNPSSSGEYTRQGSAGREIEVIDLENDSIPGDKTFEGLPQKFREETTFSGSEGFPSHIHAQNPSDISNVQVNDDGLMISEYLSAFPNTDEINSLPNDMGLHHGEGDLGDDDAIYMSLGEIPLTFIPSWEQPPPQEYDKPF